LRREKRKRFGRRLTSFSPQEDQVANLRDYGSPADIVSVEAAGRLNALGAARAQDEDASKSGPFYRDDVLSRMTPEDHQAATDHHQALADLYAKYQKPSTDTIPHTAGLSARERAELSSEVDMGRTDHSQ
jgi:hypothetical protein